MKLDILTKDVILWIAHDAHTTDIASIGKDIAKAQRDKDLKVMTDMYEALKGMLNIFDRGLGDNHNPTIGRITCDNASKVLAKVEDK